MFADLLPEPDPLLVAAQVVSPADVMRAAKGRLVPQDAWFWPAMPAGRSGGV